MPKQKIFNCPMKFNSKTLEADGFVKKETCVCDEESCYVCCGQHCRNYE
jgi:hypothetical protein